MSVFPFRRKNLVEATIVFSVILALFGWQMQGRLVADLPWAEAQSYFNHALHVYEHGTFSSDPNLDNPTPAPTRYFPPLYTLTLTALMTLDSRFARMVECTLYYQYKKVQPLLKGYDPNFNGPMTCEMNADSYFALQMLFATLAITAVYFTARMLLKSRMGAACVAGIVFLMPATSFSFGNSFFAVNIPAFYADMLSFCCYSVTMMAGIWAFTHQSWKGAAVTGALLGLTALAKPQYLYLYYIVIASMLAYAFTQRKRGVMGWEKRFFLAFFVSFPLAVSPWIIRNVIQFGSPSFTSDYAAMIFSQRAAYNDMSAYEYFWSFIYWIPEIGAKIAAKFTDIEQLKRLNDWETPTSFARYGLENLLGWADAGAAREGTSSLGYFVKHSILKHPFKHTAVCLPLAWRGILFDGYVTFPLLIAYVFALKAAIKRRWWPFLVFTAPPFFLLFLQSAVSLNVVRYNIIFYPVMAVSFVWCVREAMRKWLGMRERITLSSSALSRGSI